jgi:hypothetical protein
MWACNLPHCIRVEQRLRVFENRVLRNICLPKREDVTVHWRELHNEELPIFPSHWILLYVHINEGVIGRI